MLLLLTLLADSLAQTCPTSIEQGPYVPIVTHDEIMVWTRFGSSTTAVLHYSYDGSNWLDSIPQTSLPNAANTIGWSIPRGDTDSLYYSVVMDGCQASPIRTSHFAPAVDSPTAFEFAVTSDAFKTNQQANPPWFSIWQLNPAFVLQIGDWDHRNPGLNGNTDIAAWRQMNRDVMGEKPVGRQLNRYIFAYGIPFFHTWDDHDYCFNNADWTCPGKESAYRAYNEFYPRPNDPVPDTIAYSFQWGSLAEFFVLDTRFQRNESSMLGPDQNEWLRQSVAASTAAFKIIISSSVWNPYAKQTDAWANYPDEQFGLVAYWAEQNTTGIVVISGDMHSVGLLDDGTHGFYPNASVPPINLYGKGCTGGSCGEWSVPWTETHPHAGFGWYQVFQDEQASHMILSNRSNDGEIRNHLQVDLPTSPPSR